MAERQLSQKRHADGKDVEQSESRKLHRGSAKDRIDSLIGVEELRYLYQELWIPPKIQQQLEELGISRLDDILARCAVFKDASMENVRKKVQTVLYHFCLWHEEFKKNEDPKSDWRTAFTGDQFEAFEEKMSASAIAEVTREAAAKALADVSHKAPSRESTSDCHFTRALELVHEGDPQELAALSKSQVDLLIQHVVELVLKKLPGRLIADCQFNVQELVERCTRAIFNLPSWRSYTKIQLIAGRTQSGKSHVKAVVQATCDVLTCPLIIITKGVAESKDLAKKLDALLNQDKSDFVQWFEKANKKESNNVIADTAARINNTAIKRVHELRALKKAGKFVIIVDECDAMYRTEERSQKMEQAYDQLMELRPALRIEISATPIPAYLYLAGALNEEVEILELGTSEDYSGVTQMKPLKDAKGRPRFLSVSDVENRRAFKIGVPYTPKIPLPLKVHDNTPLFPFEDLKASPFEFPAAVFCHSERLDSIPGTDAAVMDLYNHAMTERVDDMPRYRGTLLLDCTINRVWAEDNVFQKAACIQNHFCRQNKKLVVICVVGRGIYFRRPGFERGRMVTNRKTVSEVLQQLDNECGLDIPFFVFGFSKMRRCISYRSDARVPSHMVLNLGIGQSNENLLQALGRATFNGFETILKKNGYKCVTVLVPKQDLQMAVRYGNFVHEVSERAKSGKTTAKAILQDAKEKFEDSSNYLRFSNRKTGQMKGLEEYLPDQDLHFG